MRIWFGAVALFISVSALGVDFEILAPCGSKSWLEVEVNAMPGRTVGQVTMDTLAASHLTYSGTVGGVRSIRGTVADDTAIERPSKDEMRVYRWCFMVNGKASSLPANRVPIYASSDKITWYFGYAHFVKNKWVTACMPVSIHQPRYVCGNR